MAENERNNRRHGTARTRRQGAAVRRTATVPAATKPAVKTPPDSKPTAPASKPVADKPATAAKPTAARPKTAPAKPTLSERAKHLIADVEAKAKELAADDVDPNEEIDEATETEIHKLKRRKRELAAKMEFLRSKLPKVELPDISADHKEILWGTPGKIVLALVLLYAVHAGFTSWQTRSEEAQFRDQVQAVLDSGISYNKLKQIEDWRVQGVAEKMLRVSRADGRYVVLASYREELGRYQVDTVHVRR